MTSIDTCMERLANWEYSPVETSLLLERNHQNTTLSRDVHNYGIISIPKAFKQGYKGIIPIEGDAGFFLIKNARIIALTSFDIYEDLFSVVQMQGGSPKRLTEQNKIDLGYLNWESTLLDAIECSAISLGINQTRIISANIIDAVTSGKISQKKAAMHYDLPALLRGYIQSGEGYWYKDLSSKVIQNR